MRPNVLLFFTLFAWMNQKKKREAFSLSLYYNKTTANKKKQVWRRRKKNLHETFFFDAAVVADVPLIKMFDFWHFVLSLTLSQINNDWYIDIQFS